MEKLYKFLKPMANIYTILFMWSLSIVNFYFLVKPLNDYAISASLDTIPIVLDTMNYYTSEEGYQVLSNLGEDGRNAYRLVNYVDFIFPFLICLSLTLSNIALKQRYYHIIAPFVFMIFDYLENIAEKYVLEIFPGRNDFIMNLACYFGLMKMLAMSIAWINLLWNILQYFCKRQQRSSEKHIEQKSQ
ncbi:hypothetical protein I4U23_016799 [Adineta vaga]|nr:hypothetical protein I4U23_016799 [Adineta vaga]